MEQENQLANRGGHEIKVKTKEDFIKLCESDYLVKYNAMVDEFKGRKEQLDRVKASRLKEYSFISQMIDLNTQMNSGNINPVSVMQFEKSLSAITVDDTMRSQPISYWQKEFGDGFIVPVVCDILNYFLRQFTVKESLDGNQIMQLAFKIITAQPHLRIKELVLCLNNALGGKYGPTYQRIGIETILGWLNNFYSESSAHLESMRANAKPDESRGEQPWLQQERMLKKYEDEQRAKKSITDKIWHEEKRNREVNEYKEKVLNKSK